MHEDFSLGKVDSEERNVFDKRMSHRRSISIFSIPEGAWLQGCLDIE